MNKSFDAIDILFIVLIGTYLFFFIMLIIYLICRRIENAKYNRKAKKLKKATAPVKPTTPEPVTIKTEEKPIEFKPVILATVKTKPKPTKTKQSVNKAKATNKTTSKSTSKKKTVNKTELINKDKLHNSNKQKVANNKKAAPKNNATQKSTTPKKKSTTNKKKKSTNNKNNKK